MKLLTGLLFVAFVTNTVAQNLVPNPGFEEHTSIPTNTSEWNHCINWLNPQEGTSKLGSPDLYYENGKGTDASLPGPEWHTTLGLHAFEGKSVAGIIGLSNANIHEYITARLNAKILKGDKVKISFYYSNGVDPVGMKASKLGAYFSAEMPRNENDQYLINVKPQVEMSQPLFTSEWKLFEAEFIADRDFEYVTIGSFYNIDENDEDKETEDYVKKSQTGLFSDWAYYFIDNVSVTTNGKGPVTTGTGTKYIFRGDDTKKGIKVNGKITINNAGAPLNIQDSVITIPAQKLTSIHVDADAPGYYPFHETIEGANISTLENKTHVIYLQPLTKGTTIILKNIQFNSGSPVILPASYPELDKLVNLLKANPALEIEISGHTDNLGNADKDQQLSEQRAKNVMQYLVDKGISSKRLTAIGYGMKKPIAENTTVEGRAKNRRVEFRITKGL